VIDYGDMDDLIFITAIHNGNRSELFENIGFPMVKKYDGINDLQQLKSMEEDNREGFVVRFSNGFRMKVKFAEYIRLHRIITGILKLHTIYRKYLHINQFCTIFAA